MPPANSSPSLTALARAAETLVSPLAWPSRDAWLSESLVRLRALIGADASVAMHSAADRSVISPDLPASVLSALEAHVHGSRGEVHWDDPAFERAYTVRRRAPSRIYTMRELRAALGNSLYESPIYQTVIEPTGLLASVSIGVLGDDSETLLSLMARNEKHFEMGPEQLACLQLLRTSFVAGLETLRRLERWRHQFTFTLDQIGAGMIAFSRDGREVTRNRRLEHLLREEPARDQLLATIRRVAQVTAGPRARRLRSNGLVNDQDQTVELTGGGKYRLVASTLEAGVMGRDEVILVLVDVLRYRLPATQHLVSTYGLTSREAEVALLVAEGLSNKEIAERMRLSVHTVRHRIERIFEQLNLRSRKALALHLLRAEFNRSFGSA